MKPPFLAAALLLLSSAGCVTPPPAGETQLGQTPHRFDSIAAGMTRKAVIEMLGAPQFETEQGLLGWEDRYDAENYDSLEVGFDQAGAVIFIEKTKRKQTVQRT